MPRPCKRRRVCDLPANRSFGPVEQGSAPACWTVVMAVEEYECIRLIDLEGLTQEECAQRMDVARTTVQAIYNSARFKLAQALVHGRMLVIEGGEYALCQGDTLGCARKNSLRCRWDLQENDQEESRMKIAVTYEAGQIFPHFGHTEQFKVYEVEDGQIKTAAVVDTNGSGHGALAGFLKNAGVDILICGGIGGGACQALAQAGITLYAGVSGSADEAVNALLSGALKGDASATCRHHEGHHHGHDCGSGHEHGCGHGEHHCGGHN